MNTEAQLAEREGDLAKVAEIRYGKATELQKRLEEANQKLTRLQADSKMLKEEVDDEDVAEVVSRWTGIPVSKMLEGEREKLVQMEERLHNRVIGQDPGGGSGIQCCAPGALRVAGPQSPHRLIYFHGTHRRRKDRTGQGTGRFHL